MCPPRYAFCPARSTGSCVVRCNRRITRRAALRGAAVAGAASLVRPAIGLGANSRSPVFSRVLGSLAGESAMIPTPRQFALLGVEWSGPVRAQIELRTRRSDRGAWSAWTGASVLGHGPDRVVSRSTHFGEPIWTGPADYVQLRSSSPVRGVRLHFVAAGVGGTAWAQARAGPRTRPRRSRWPSRSSTPAPASRRSSRARPGPRATRHRATDRSTARSSSRLSTTARARTVMAPARSLRS